MSAPAPLLAVFLALLCCLFGLHAGSPVGSNLPPGHRFKVECNHTSGICVYTLRVRPGPTADEMERFRAVARAIAANLTTQGAAVASLDARMGELDRRLSAAVDDLAAARQEARTAERERNQTQADLWEVTERLAKVEEKLEEALRCRQCPSVDPCAPGPCLYNGTCEATSGGDFRCHCTAGRTGKRCEKEVVDSNCNPDPCLNGGECMKGPCGLRCHCQPGWAGPTCAKPAGDPNRPCQASPCFGGKCVEAPEVSGGFRCLCDTNWGGRLCQAFRPTWQTSSGCDSLRYRSGNGSVASHKDFNGMTKVYPPDRRCSWTFGAEMGTQICLNFNHMSLRAGEDWDTHDYLTVVHGPLSDPTRATEKRYLPWESPGMVCSRSHEMSLLFVSRKRKWGATWGTGFKLNYETRCLQ